MQILEILLAAAALFLFVLSLISNDFTDSMVLLILCFITLFASVHRPRVLYVKRLNPFFVIVHYPYCKWHSIYQMPFKRQRKFTVKQPCSRFYQGLSHQMVDMFSFIDTEHGFYRTITHQTIKDRIEAYQERGRLKILTCRPAYQKSLLKNQGSLLYHKCRKCPDADQCRFRRISKVTRQFYYIEFFVPTHEKG